MGTGVCMIIEFLEKERRSRQSEYDALSLQLQNLELEIRENNKFIQVLSDENNLAYEPFSPYEYHDSDFQKIKELRYKNRINKKEIEELQIRMEKLSNLLNEYDDVICEAKKKGNL